MNVANLSATQAAQIGAILSSALAAPSPVATLAAETALSAIFAGVPSLSGSAAGAASVEAHIGPLSSQAPAPSSGAAPLAFVYVPQGAPTQSIRLRDPSTGAGEVVSVHANGVLVYHSELVAEAASGTLPVLVQGTLLASSAPKP